jgi:TadE-like protein
VNRLACLLARLRSNDRGSVAIEFAILAPALFMLLLGVLAMGLFTFSQNALRSVAADTARYTVVEHQKSNRLINEQIESKAVAIAVNTPYGLDIDRIDATVTRPTTDIAGTIKFQIDLVYTPYSPLEFARIRAPRIAARRILYVAI